MAIPTLPMLFQAPRSLEISSFISPITSDISLCPVSTETGPPAIVLPQSISAIFALPPQISIQRLNILFSIRIERLSVEDNESFPLKIPYNL